MEARYKPYSEYKDSTIEWLREIPAHWDVSKLRYMFSFGKGLGITKENLLDDGVFCVNYGEVHSKYGFELDPSIHQLKCVSEDYLISSQSALLLKGDLVFADTSEDIDGSGNFTQLTTDHVVFSGYHTIIARPADRQCSRFYAYLFDSREFRAQIRYAVKGVKVFSITQAILRGVNIWLPTLDERQKITNFLDHETAKIDTLIEKQQQLIQLLKEKRQAVISHAVTKGLNPKVKMRDSGVEWLGEVPTDWKISKLKYHTRLFEQGWSPQCDSRQAEGDEFGVLKVGCVNYGTFDSNENKALPKELTPRLQYLIQQGDLLISRANTKDLVGSAAVVDKNYDKIILCDKLYRLRFNESIEPQWAAYYLALPIVRQQIELGASGASHSMQNIGQSTIKELPIVIPSPKEVGAILLEVKNKTAIFELTLNLANDQIALLHERRTALISAAVTGKIDVRNWVAPKESQANKTVAA
ncbi:restriction endonuclease subunit S [Pseudomonas lactis]|uniref:restriction endonuclease subunit S n=1 Tax=Pseudomonas lactis TaxID=1615674 RepID=UPI00289A3C68|nr:restriction endonuclease subunit S [Pseudomonas lactis]